MLSVSIASIVISVISLIGVILSTVINQWFPFYSDRLKRRAQSEALLAKFRDPLLLAAQDLQSRLYGILEWELLKYQKGPEQWKKLLYSYTIYQIGQYFSWAYILRRQTQFLCFTNEADARRLVKIMDRIQRVFNSDQYRTAGEPFMLWRAQQMVIGEMMTIKEDGQLFSMGYAEFERNYEMDEHFRKGFENIESGITKLGDANASGAPVPDHRLRHLHHLLMDLIHFLDPKKVRVDPARANYCQPAPDCTCSYSDCVARRETIGNRRMTV